MSYWAIAGYIFHLHTILRAEPTAEGGRKKKKTCPAVRCVCVRESQSEEKRQRKTEERESKM